jgi:putative ABC transport system permease protein
MIGGVGTWHRLTPVFRHLLQQATESFLRRPLRTVLSLLSVVLGIGAVVAMLSVVEGARRQVLGLAERIGFDTIVIESRPSQSTVGGPRRGLTVADATGLAKLRPAVAVVSPVVLAPTRLSGPAGSEVGFVIASSADYASTAHLAASRGRLLTPLDDDGTLGVCVMGASIARQLWGSVDPVGRFLQVRADYYTVVGVLDEHPMVAAGRALGFPVVDVDRAVVVPLARWIGHPTAADPLQRLDEVRLRARDSASVVGLGAAVDTSLLSGRRDGRDYEVIVPQTLAEQRLQVQRTFGYVLASVATLSLLIGGVGIMNVTLASVLERVPEIGIRRTVGATQRSVAALFLTETALLGALGGLLGLIAGAGLSTVIAKYAGWPMAISGGGALTVLAVAMVVGLVSGVYPAWRATRIAPIDALGHE